MKGRTWKLLLAFVLIAAPTWRTWTNFRSRAIVLHSRQLTVKTAERTELPDWLDKARPYLPEYMFQYVAKVEVWPELLKDKTATAEILKHISRLKGLNELRVNSRSDKFQFGKPATFPAKFLAGAQDLRMVRIYNCKLDSDDIRTIASINDLEILNLCSCDLSPPDMRHLESMPHLMWLTVSNFSEAELQQTREWLPYVYVENVQIDDDG